MTYEQVIRFHNRVRSSIRDKAWAEARSAPVEELAQRLETQVHYVNLLHRNLSIPEFQFMAYRDEDLKNLLRDVWRAEAVQNALLSRLSGRASEFELRITRKT